MPSTVIDTYSDPKTGSPKHLDDAEAASRGRNTKQRAVLRVLSDAQSSQAKAQPTAESRDADVTRRKRRSGVRIRLAQASEADFQAALALARASHERTIFKDIPFSEKKVRSLFEKAVTDPDRIGLLFAHQEPQPTDQLTTDLLGFAYVHAGEYFLGESTLIATVQTLNISSRISNSILAGRVTVRLVQSIQYWSQVRNCAHLLYHVTTGFKAEKADRFLRRIGMQTIGGNYIQKIYESK